MTEDKLTAPAAQPVDPEAPYGRYERGPRAGQPRARPARPGGPLAGRARRAGAGAGRPNPPPPRRAPRPPTATAAAPGARQLREARAEAAAGVLQMLAMPAALVPDPTGAIALDVAAVSLHTPRLAAGAARTAEQVPWMALALDRLAAVGPYKDSISAAIALAAQIAVNHGGPIEMGRKFGAVSRERMQAWLLGQARAEAEQDRAALQAEADAFAQLQAEAAAGHVDQADDVDQADGHIRAAG